MTFHRFARPALLLLALIPAFASAGVDHCSVAPAPLAKAPPPPPLILGSFAWQDGSVRSL